MQQRIDQGQEQRLKLREDFDRLQREEADLVAQVDQLEQERVRRPSFWNASLLRARTHLSAICTQAELVQEKNAMQKAHQQWLKAKSRLGTVTIIIARHRGRVR